MEHIIEKAKDNIQILLGAVILLVMYIIYINWEVVFPRKKTKRVVQLKESSDDIDDLINSINSKQNIK